MKVTLNPVSVYRANYVNNLRGDAVKKQQELPYRPYGLISFAGNKNPKQIAIIAAEAPPYFKVGGVASVIDDYVKGHVFPEGSDLSLHMPYYNGMRYYDESGELLKDVVPVTHDGKYYLVSADMKGTSFADIKDKYKFEIEKVASDTMEFAGKDEPVSVFKAKGKNHFFYFTDDTARMIKPYANGEYSSKGLVPTMGDGADSYAKSMKAVTTLMPKLETSGVNPQYIVLNDSQTAFFPEYVARKVTAEGSPYWSDAKMFYLQHNLGDGTYQGPSSFKTMFMNFADKKQVEAVWKDPAYHIAIRDNATEEYFKKFFYDIPDKTIAKNARKVIQKADGSVVASMIPIRYAYMNNLTGIAPVSEEYAKSVMEDPAVTKGLASDLKELADKGKFRGILNGMNNASIDPTLVSGLDYYKQEVKNAAGKVFKPFETYDSKWFESLSPVEAMEKIQAVKDKNKANLFSRLTQDMVATPEFAIGKSEPDYSIIGHIDKKWIDTLNNTDKKGKVDLFVSWGRGDEQKGLDIVLDGFRRFLKLNPEESKNSVLILGGQIKDTPAEKIIREQMKNPLFDGRVVFMDGFAPNTILAGAGDAAIFPSRFAPCELTDLEAMKMGTTPIVTNLQGLAQKNITFAENAEKATSYKTTAHSFMSFEDAYKSDTKLKALCEKLETEYTAELKHAYKKTGEQVSAFTDDEIKAIISKRLKDSPLVKKEFKAAKDRLIAKDLAKAMLEKVSETPTQRATLMKNGMLANVGWRNNNAFHPGETTLSSADIYNKFFLQGNWEKFKKTLFNYDLMPDISSAGTGASNSTRNIIASGIDGFAGRSKFLNKRVMATVAGVLALGAWGYYLFKDDKTPQKHPSSYIA